MSSNKEEDVIKNKVSRRNFIVGAAAGALIAGVAVAGVEEMRILQLKPSGGTTTTVTTTKTVTIGTTGTTTTIGTQLASSSIVTLNVNGTDMVTKVDNRLSLAETLREKFNLIGTKLACDRGECGACSVLVDGIPMLSCMMLAVAAQGKKITTIEGIGMPEKLSNIQAALIDNDGVQCGACVPGIVIVATAFQKKNPSATDDQWRAALAGNICRCSNWPFMLQGLESVK
jgi:xanthine dehydrogenase YagT iron-sulfur-binding subunit